MYTQRITKMFSIYNCVLYDRSFKCVQVFKFMYLYFLIKTTTPITVWFLQAPLLFPRAFSPLEGHCCSSHPPMGGHQRHWIQQHRGLVPWGFIHSFNTYLQITQRKPFQLENFVMYHLPWWIIAQIGTSWSYEDW